MLFRFRRHRRIVALAAAATLTGATLHTQSQSQPPVIRSGVDLVVVDVHVVDRSGQPITTLTPEDFEVTIDRGRRKVVSADLVQYGRAAAASPDQAMPLPAASAPASAAARRFILAIDEHSFRPASAKAAMRAASGFIDQLLPTDLVGLYTYPTGASHSDRPWITQRSAAVWRRWSDSWTSLSRGTASPSQRSSTSAAGTRRRSAKSPHANAEGSIRTAPEQSMARPSR